MKLLSLTMAYEHVRAGFGRMALSVLAVALGVALVVAVQLMNGAVLASFLDTVDAVAGRAALTVSAGEGLTFSEEVVGAVAGVRGVKLAVPLVRSVAFPDDGSGEVLTVHGVDLAHEEEVRVYHAADDPTEVIEDPLVFLSRPDSVVLTREFAARRGLALESRVALVTPKGVKPFTVRGLLEPQGLAKTLGGRLVVMDLYAAEQAFTAAGQINQIDVLVAEGAPVEGVKAAIGAMLPVGLKVEEPSLRKQVIGRAVAGFQAVLTAFGLLAVVAGIVICYSRLGAIFEARTWEVGLLRAVGLRRSTVFLELLKESLLLGAIGTAAGLPIGVLIARYGSAMAANAAALNFRTPKVTTAPFLSLDAFGLGAVSGLMAALLAAAIPAARLARKQPVAALTMRGREGPGSIRGFGGFLGLALLLVSAALVVWQQRAGISWLGNLTTALLAIAACAFSAPLIRRSSHVLITVWQHTFGASGEFAALHITENSRRVALTVATLGIGLGAILMFGILGWSFERSLVQQVTARLQADLVVTSAFESGGWVSAPIGEDVLEEIEGTPGVVLAAGTRVKDLSYSETAITLYAYDNSCFLDRRMCDWRLVSGALPDAMAAIASGVGAIVSPSFVQTFGLMPGSTIVLESPRGPQEFRIVGITETQPDTAIIISRSRFRSSWNDTFVTWAFGLLANREQAEFVESALAERVGDKYRVRVRPVGALIGFLAGQAHDAFRALYVMEAVALFLVFIGIGDALAAGVLERIRQLAMMRAIGLRRSQVFSIILLEGAAIAVLGLSLAAATGGVLGAFWVNVQFPAVLGWSLCLHFPFVLPLVTFVVSIGLCLVASLLPGLRAAGLPIAQCLRNE